MRDPRRAAPTFETVGPLSRLVDVANVPPHGSLVHVVATEDECAALARDFKLPAIRALKGDYRLSGSAKGVHVAGTVTAAVTQICVVTLDEFDSILTEEVEVDFAEPGGMPRIDDVAVRPRHKHQLDVGHTIRPEPRLAQ